MNSSKHHVYPKKWRHPGSETETKKVRRQDHQDYHIIFSDDHPKDVILSLDDVLDGRKPLTPKQAAALVRLMNGRTKEESKNFIIDKFLPTEIHYQAQKIEERQKISSPNLSIFIFIDESPITV